MIVDFLDPSSGFQTSVNIGYDLNDKEKIASFIPTSSAVSLLETVLLSTDASSTNRAHILVGAYGKGKSHIILSILSLLYHKDENAVARLLKKTAEHDPQLYEYAKEFIRSDKRLLPVIISGNSTSITQAFLRAIYSALKENNLLMVMPETNYQMALRMITLWKENYPEVYQHLQDSLPMPIKEFEAALTDYDTEAYSAFEKLYPQLTAGNEFNPLSGYDVVELYETVCEKLHEHGFSGIYVVYDEFSKYLESSITKASINEIKMLQDFAEKCNRSGSNQLHLLLISHKEIENYIDVLPKQKVDGWRGVSERFSHIIMLSDYAQTYEVLGTAIRKKEPEWSRFKANHESFFQSLMDQYRPSALFSDCSEKQLQQAVVECYPMHPMSTFLLPRISERVAQNERTLFTFVAGQGKSTLNHIKIEAEHGVPTVTPDRLFDYFAPQMRKETFTSEVHQLYSLTNEILLGLNEDQLEAKIVKTIALIYCVGQFNSLPPTIDSLVQAFSSEDVHVDTILEAVDSLIKKRLVVYLKRSNSFLQLKKSSGIDVYAEIKNTVEKRKDIISPATILNAANVEPFLYPIRYNDERTMTRYFAFRFITLSDASDSLPGAGDEADGLVLGVIPDRGSLDDLEIKELTKRCSECSRIVLAFPYETAGIEEELRMFDAVVLLRNELSDDTNLKNEYDIIYQDLLEVINQYITQFIQPALHRVQYWSKGKKLAIYRKSQLTEALSLICDEEFPNTPAINNEVLNRNKLTSVATNSRTRLLEALMQKQVPFNLGLVGSSQEISFMRSTLLVTGLLSQNELGGTLSLTSTDVRLNNVLNEIVSFLEETKQGGAKSFGELYETLTGIRKGIGLRKGVLPVYIALCLRQFEDHYVIWDKQEEKKLTPMLLNQINDDPGKYMIRVEDWTDEKEAYLCGLSSAFNDYIIEKEKTYGQYSYIALAMNRWYLSLPKYVKDTNEIYEDGKFIPVKKEHLRFLKLLKQAGTGAQNLLFNRLPKCFDCEAVGDILLNKIIAAKNNADRIKDNLESELIAETIRVFGTGNYSLGLCACGATWIDALPEISKTKLYPNGAERIIGVLKEPGNDERELINRLARAVTGLRIEDWNSSSVLAFLSRLKQFKDTIESESLKYESAEVAQDEGISSDHYAVTFIDQQGKAKRRTFQRAECSKRARLLQNRISSDIRDMGHSITQEEKRQVLMEILETLC